MGTYSRKGNGIGCDLNQQPSAIQSPAIFTLKSVQIIALAGTAINAENPIHLDDSVLLVYPYNANTPLVYLENASVSTINNCLFGAAVRISWFHCVA